MSIRPTRATLSGLTLGLALISGSATAGLAQDDGLTAADIAAGNASGAITLTGAALVRGDDDEYYFSDGLGVVEIEIEGAADRNVPLFTLITIEGRIDGDEVDVTSWEPLDILVPAVIVLPEEVKSAFEGWIVAHGSMAPEDGTASE